MTDINVHSLVAAFCEIERVLSAARICKTCVYFEAPIRGGHRHCALNMAPYRSDDSCEEWEFRLPKTRAGQLQLPLELASVE
jgi:hypothetical protein